MGFFRRESGRAAAAPKSSTSAGPQSQEEVAELFRSSWPEVPPSYADYMKVRWASLLANLSAGRADHDLEIMTSNLAGSVVLMAAPADCTNEDLSRWYNSVVSALGPAAEHARGMFEQKAFDLLDELRSK